MTSVKKLATQGAIWTIVGYGLSQILRFGGNLILTRLLVPEFFGLMALANTLRIGIELFSDIGIGQSIICNKRGDEPVFLNTAWTLQVIRGLTIWLFCLLISWPVSRFYHEDRLLWLIPMIGITSVLDGLSSTAINTFERRIEVRKSITFELIVQILSLFILIALAWSSPTVLSLAIGIVLGAILRTVGSFWLIPGYVHRFGWNLDVVKEIISFGKWMFAASALMFLADQADRLILAKLLSFQLLGIYTVAYTLANVPREIIKNLSSRVIFPAISNKLDLPRASLRAKILHQRRGMLIGFAILVAVLVTVGDLVIGQLYDSRYAQATWMMPILCCGIWFSLLFYTISPTLLAIGKASYSAQSNLARFIMISFGLPTAFYSFGTVGAIVLIALSDLPLYIVNSYGLWREKLSCIVQDLQGTAFFIGVLTLLLVIRNSLGFGFPIQGIL